MAVLYYRNSEGDLSPLSFGGGGENLEISIETEILFDGRIPGGSDYPKCTFSKSISNYDEIIIWGRIPGGTYYSFGNYNVKAVLQELSKARPNSSYGYKLILSALNNETKVSIYMIDETSLIGSINKDNVDIRAYGIKYNIKQTDKGV